MLFITLNNGKFKPRRRKHYERYKNFFRLKKQLNYTAIKYTRNLFRLEKKLMQLKVEHQ